MKVMIHRFLFLITLLTVALTACKTPPCCRVATCPLHDRTVQRIHRKETRRDKEVRNLEQWLSSDRLLMASWRTKRNQRKLAYWQGKDRPSRQKSDDVDLETWQNNEGLKRRRSSRSEQKKLESFQRTGSQPGKGKTGEQTSGIEMNASFSKRNHRKENRDVGPFQDGSYHQRKRDRQKIRRDKKGKVNF